jgi:hypothetical protein
MLISPMRITGTIIKTALRFVPLIICADSCATCIRNCHLASMDGCTTRPLAFGVDRAAGRCRFFAANSTHEGTVRETLFRSVKTVAASLSCMRRE